MSQFSLQYPYALALILLFWLCAKFCAARAEAIYFPHIHNLLAKEGKRSRFLDVLKWLGIISLIVALSSPVITKSYKDTKKKGRDIMLVIDSSGSMNQRGFDMADPMKNKFSVVKEVVLDFIDKRKQDRLGLITFADVAFVASPLTFENNFLKDIVKMQNLGMAGRKTAINDALLQTYSVLSKSDAKTKIAILLTDGIENMSKISMEDILGVIQKSDIRLYAIGIGSYRDFDARYLKKLAKAGKGQFFAADSKEALAKIYAEIDKLEASKIKSKKIVQHTYLYIYPLFAAIILLLLFLYFRTARGLES
ncbi:MAG: VWA domain-containing protein [Sulfurovum sp.]|nr:VWA domain-containing protein [Sulfurovum sp.]